MNKNTKNLAISGGAFLIGVSALAYFILKRSPKQPVAARKRLSRETLIAILNSLKREQYSAILKIQQAVSNLKQAKSNQSVNERKQLVLNDAEIKAKLSIINISILEKNDISEDDYTYNCQVVFKKDKEIQQLLQALSGRISDVAEGKSVDLSATIPQSLNSSCLLKIHKEISEEIVRQQHEAFKSTQSEIGDFNLTNPLAISNLNKIDFEAIRNQILSKYSLDSYEETAAQIFDYATEKNKQENSSFRSELKANEVNLQKSFENYQDILKAAQEKINQALTNAKKVEVVEDDDDDDGMGLFD